MSEDSKASFLRQSGWIALATAIGGAASFAVHLVAKDLPKAEYGIFTTVLQILNLVAIPAIGLQAVVSKKIGSAKTEEDNLQILAAEKFYKKATMALCLALIPVFALTVQPIEQSLQTDNPIVVFTLFVSGFMAFLIPCGYGVLQGKQAFYWLGMGLASLGVSRLVLVYFMHLFSYDPNQTVDSDFNIMRVMWALMLSYAFTYFFVWKSTLEYFDWNKILKEVKFDWKPWASSILPLSVGGGTIIYLMSVDMVFVQRYFDKDQTGLYAAAGMIGRALIFFVGPMVAVMFPKLVKSHAERKPTDVLRFTLLLTAGLCAVAITLGVLVPDLPLRLVYDESFLQVTPLIPWFIAAMAPLALAAVLVNNILARCTTNSVYLLLGVPIIHTGLLFYAVPQIAEQTAGTFNVHAHITMVGLIGMGNLCFLASTVILTWVVNQEEKLLLAQAQATENPPPDEAEAH